MSDYCSKCNKESSYELDLALKWQFFMYNMKRLKGYYCKECLKSVLKTFTDGIDP